MFGHPSKVGYKDVVKLWKAENFDPQALMSLFVEAGARYFMAQAAHHDNFHNWYSSRHHWNAIQVRPHKAIVVLWQVSAQERGRSFGLTEHLGASFTWYKSTKGADRFGPYAGIPYVGNSRGMSKDPESVPFVRRALQSSQTGKR